MVDIGNIHGLHLGAQHQQPGPNDPLGPLDNDGQPPVVQPDQHGDPPGPTNAEAMTAMMARMAELEAQLAVFQAPQPAAHHAPNPTAMLQQQAQYAAAAAAGTHTTIPDVTVGQLASVDLTCEYHTRSSCFSTGARLA